MESMESAGHSATILNTNKCIPAQQGEHVLLRGDQQGEHVLLRVGAAGMHFLVFRILRAWELESARLGNRGPQGWGTGIRLAKY